MKTKVHYSDVLSATDGRLVSTSGINGIYKVFDAVAGPGVTTIALLYLGDTVKDYLKKKFPKYASREVKEALDLALTQWKMAYPDDKARKEAGAESMKFYLDQHVLPLVGDEYVEVEHMGDKEVEKLGEGYGDFLGEKLAGKEVIVVQTDK